MSNTKAKQEAERVTVYRHDMKPCELAVHITTNPGAYGASHVELAKAYESQRERIADLEDDVERLRPREAFTPETLFEFDSLNTKVLIDTDSGGGLCIDATDIVTDSDVVTMLTKGQSHQLAQALATWAGLPSGVEWHENIDPPPMDTYILIGGSKNTSVGYCNSSSGWQESCRMSGVTHWAPLPKPPEAK